MPTWRRIFLTERQQQDVNLPKLQEIIERLELRITRAIDCINILNFDPDNQDFRIIIAPIKAWRKIKPETKETLETEYKQCLPENVRISRIYLTEDGKNIYLSLKKRLEL